MFDLGMEYPLGVHDHEVPVIILREINMRFVGMILCAAVLTAASAFATVSSPTNLTVTQKRDTTGNQYFHITFKKVPSTDTLASHYSYQLLRWKGALPDTSGQTLVTTLYQSGDSIAVYDDKSSVFNLTPADSHYAATYSYSVRPLIYSYDSLHHGTYEHGSLITPVSGTLDTTYIHFTHVVESHTGLHNGDTVHGTFTAVENSSAAIRYSITSVSAYVSGGAPANSTGTAWIDSVTGDFWATITTPVTVGSVTLRVAVHATDPQGRYAEARTYLTVAAAPDTLTVFLSDGTNPLHAGTTCYIGLFPASTDTTHTPTVSYNQVSSDGHITVICANALYTLRIGAEGYQATWVNDPNGNATISASGTVHVTLNAATMHTISGHAHGVHDTALKHCIIKLHRTLGYSHYNTVVKYAYTDSTGAYSMQVSEGDSLLVTTGVYVEGNMTGYTDSVQYWDHTTSANKTLLVVNTDYTNIDFSFSTQAPQVGTVVIYFVGASGDSAHGFGGYLTVYQLVDTAFVQRGHVDTVTNGRIEFQLPLGKYLFFGVPFDTARMAGYYKRDAYAATWQEADTAHVNSTGRFGYTLQMPLDTTIAHATGGTPIDGVISTPRGPMANTHLLLYQPISAPAGTTGNRRLVSGTMTNGYGMYKFGHLAPGLYTLAADIIGSAQTDLADIIIDTTGTPVHKNITYGSNAVEDGIAVLPGTTMLAQNYPNPFTTSTTIGYTVATRGAVDLSVYDMSGRLVQTLVRGELPQGTYRTELRGELRDGVYTCVLRSAGVVSTRMISVVR